MKKFEDLWEQGVSVTEDYIEAVENKTWLNDITPYEIYLKMLYEFFKEEMISKKMHKGHDRRRYI